MTQAPIGVIADDYTGASDVAAALRVAGLRTRLLFGTPEGVLVPATCDAVVVGTKTRTISSAAAVRTATAWLRVLRRAGVERLYLKYCSTFDSTALGNIGPVADALLDAMSLRQTVVCPTSPSHGRTVFRGHLFVGSQLLSDSSMRDHPLTPMRDSRLEHLLGAQTRHPVGAIGLETVLAGVDAVRAELARLRGEGVVHVVVDSVTSEHLDTVVAAAGGEVLLTGAAGLAAALGRSLSARDDLEDDLPVVPPARRSMILAGSCSPTTLTQVEEAAALFTSRRVSPLDADSQQALLTSVTAWVDEHRAGTRPLLVHSGATRAERDRTAHVFGDRTGGVLERVLARTAQYAVRTAGVDRVVVAGGETSGAVIEALGVRAVEVGAELDPGIPWLVARDGSGLSMVLKSGNFGADDLLVRAVGTQAAS
ncbi:MAG TPA: 3-oxo-tetronate kinase [Nocardioides sp.]|jgi:uncharacterized protein YgbK (DUF1537 family)|uniref:3-oxo-tetronate kinase n=1 Tax=Nocardioides sp. TaxID=35761 RepID=UPI002E33FF77|nr:3-oxo-tetronate kinase [Nocardioides sp.]HEX3931793.1 3-oxo-tetronate kinase [Nocardioides sp.]